MDASHTTTVLITGGGAGIGRGVAAAAAAKGWNVALLDRSPQALEETERALADTGTGVLTVIGDATSPDDLQALADRTVERFGSIDGAVTTAGGFADQIPVDDISPANWDAGISLNLSSAFYTCKAVVPPMVAQGSGSIVVVSSAAARTTQQPNTVYYSAAKAGTLGMVRHLAFELGPSGVRVNAVAPGTTITPRIEQLYDAERMERIRSRIPLGRIAEIDDQVGPIMFLLSDASGYVTGATLDVNGGRVMV